MSSSPPPIFCPYKGLQPYTDSETDQEYFFGREREQEIIISNLYAARLTVLYGVSGVGKSSVLMAGVVPQLKEEPKTAVVFFRRWQSTGLLPLLKSKIAHAVAQKTSREVAHEGLALDDFLLKCRRALRGPLFVIFDQFEEFFLYHPPSESSEAFDTEFARAVNRDDLEANFLLSMREDGLSNLDRFQGRIPRLMGNLLRLEHLTQEAGRKAIIRPLEPYNRSLMADRPTVSAEDKLVETLLEEVQTGKVALAQTGQGQIGAREDADRKGRIEAPFLQMVLTRLWDEEMAASSRVLRLETLWRLGGAERIVRTHLDKVMERLIEHEREAAVRLFRHLVTPSGMKIAHTPADLASYVELPPAAVERILRLLASPEVLILRPVTPPPGRSEATRYEIFHDVLAPSVLDWGLRYADQQKQKQLRRLRTRVALLSLLLFFALSSFAFALYQWRAVERGRTEARSREIAAYAVSQLPSNPDLGLLLAIEAARVSPTESARNALMQTLSSSHVRALMRGHPQTVNDVAFSADERYLLTGDAGAFVYVWETETGEVVAMPRGHVSPVIGVTFSPTGNHAASVSIDGTLLVWSTNPWQEAATLKDTVLMEDAVLAHLTFSPDGRHIAVGGKGVVAVWDWQNKQKVGQQQFEQGAIKAVGFSRDGQRLVVVSAQGHVHVWNWKAGKAGTSTQIYRSGRGFLSTTDPMISAVFDPAGDEVLGVYRSSWGFYPGYNYVSKINSEYAFKISSLEDSASAPGEAGDFAAFSQNGNFIAVSSGGSYAKVWYVYSGKLIASLYGHSGKITSLKFSPNGKFVATASEDRTARVWKVENDPAELKGSIEDLLALAQRRKMRELNVQEQEKYLSNPSAK